MADFEIFGVHAVMGVLDLMREQALEASAAIVKRSQAVVEAEAKRQFTGAHPRGTPTTSRPGAPPDVVSGTLRRSIRSDQVRREGAFGASGNVYPTAVYARIIELGGTTGRGHRTHLPPRPYMAPAHDKAQARLHEIATEEWRHIFH